MGYRVSAPLGLNAELNTKVSTTFKTSQKTFAIIFRKWQKEKTMV
jgi:hypothetical protein